MCRSATSITGQEQSSSCRALRRPRDRHRTQVLLLGSPRVACCERIAGSRGVHTIAPTRGGISANPKGLDESARRVSPDRHWRRCAGSDHSRKDNEHTEKTGPDILRLHPRSRPNRGRDEAGDGNPRPQASRTRIGDPTRSRPRDATRRLTASAVGTQFLGLALGSAGVVCQSSLRLPAWSTVRWSPYNRSPRAGSAGTTKPSRSLRNVPLFESPRRRGRLGNSLRNRMVVSDGEGKQRVAAARQWSAHAMTIACCRWLGPHATCGLSSEEKIGT